MKYVTLMYHRIENPCTTKSSVTPEAFKEQILFLKNNGYSSIDLNKPLGDVNKKVLITFDDGHKSNLEAARYLHQQGFVGVFYLVKDFSLNKPEYLNENDIKEMSDMGHIMGVHGYDHNWWTMKTEHQLINELRETFKWIQQVTSQIPITCSAPGGRIKCRELKCIRRNMPEFKYIRNSVSYYSDSNSDFINAIAVNSLTSINDFSKIINKDCLYFIKSYLVYNIKEFVKTIIYKIKY